MISLLRPKHVVPWRNDNVYVVIDGLGVTYLYASHSRMRSFTKKRQKWWNVKQRSSPLLPSLHEQEDS